MVRSHRQRQNRAAEVRQGADGQRGDPNRGESEWCAALREGFTLVDLPGQSGNQDELEDE